MFYQLNTAINCTAWVIMRRCYISYNDLWWIGSVFAYGYIVLGSDYIKAHKLKSQKGPLWSSGLASFIIQAMGLPWINSCLNWSKSLEKQPISIKIFPAMKSPQQPLLNCFKEKLFFALTFLSLIFILNFP